MSNRGHKYKLSEKYPQLAIDWDHTKNEPLELDELAESSRDRCWWKCQVCGHEWMASVYSRTRQANIKCPECSKQDRKNTGRLADNSKRGSKLAEVNPTLASEWNYVKNAPATPNDVTANINRKYWWHCDKCGYDWNAPISNRNRGAGCPACAHQVLWPGHNDLLSEYPDLACEWDYDNNEFKPSDVVAGGHKKVSWICSHCGNKWKAAIVARIRGNNCPKCSFSLHTSLPEQIIYFYIKKSFPEALNGYRPDWLDGREIDIYIPSLKLAIEYDGAGWHQNNGKDEDKTAIIRAHNISLVRIREPKCPEIDDGSKQIITSTPDGHFKYLKDALCKLFEYISVISGKNYLFEGNVEDDYSQILSKLVSERKDNSAATLPFIDEWDFEKNIGISPQNLSQHSNRMVWWKCKTCGYEWRASIDHRHNYGCARCAGEVLWIGKNDLSSTRPDLLEIWDYEANDVSPNDVMVNSHRRVGWKCKKCGYRWEAPLYSVSAGHGCPYCGGSIVWSGHNDLKTKAPQLLEEWDYSKNDVDPSEMAYGSSKKAWWKCRTCGYSWEASVHGRVDGRGCPACANRVLWPGHNDLATKFPELLEEWDYKNNDISPTAVGTGSSIKVWWVCRRCKHSWQAKIIQRTRGSGCPKCNQHGRPSDIKKG